MKLTTYCLWGLTEHFMLLSKSVLLKFFFTHEKHLLTTISSPFNWVIKLAVSASCLTVDSLVEIIMIDDAMEIYLVTLVMSLFFHESVLWLSLFIVKLVISTIIRVICLIIMLITKLNTKKDEHRKVP